MHRIARHRRARRAPGLSRPRRGRRGRAAVQRYLLIDLGFHRIQLKCYGFNERAIRHSERAGFIREGVERKAYLRHGEWQDAVLFGLLREDLDE